MCPAARNGISAIPVAAVFERTRPSPLQLGCCPLQRSWNRSRLQLPLVNWCAASQTNPRLTASSLSSLPPNNLMYFRRVSPCRNVNNARSPILSSPSATRDARARRRSSRDTTGPKSGVLLLSTWPGSPMITRSGTLRTGPVISLGVRTLTAAEAGSRSNTRLVASRLPISTPRSAAGVTFWTSAPGAVSVVLVTGRRRRPTARTVAGPPVTALATSTASATSISAPVAAAGSGSSGPRPAAGASTWRRRRGTLRDSVASATCTLFSAVDFAVDCLSSTTSLSTPAAVREATRRLRVELTFRLGGAVASLGVAATARSAWSVCGASAIRGAGRSTSWPVAPCFGTAVDSRGREPLATCNRCSRGACAASGVSAVPSTVAGTAVAAATRLSRAIRTSRGASVEISGVLATGTSLGEEVAGAGVAARDRRGTRRDTDLACLCTAAASTRTRCSCFTASAGGSVASFGVSSIATVDSGGVRRRRSSGSNGFIGVSVGAALGATRNTISGGRDWTCFNGTWGSSDSVRNGTLMASVTWRVTSGVAESSNDCSSSTFS